MAGRSIDPTDRCFFTGINNFLRRGDAESKNYWRNISENGLIRGFVNYSDWEIPDQFETVMDGGTMTVTVSDEQI